MPPPARLAWWSCKKCWPTSYEVEVETIMPPPARLAWSAGLPPVPLSLHTAGVLNITDDEC